MKFQVRDKVENSSTPTAGTSNRVYRCTECLEHFSKLSEFRTHTCSQGNKNCEICDLSFANLKALQIHMKVHEMEIDNNQQRSFICGICGTEFSTHKSLRLHSRMHAPVRARHVEAPEGTKDSTFTCFECGKNQQIFFLFYKHQNSGIFVNFFFILSLSKFWYFHQFFFYFINPKNLGFSPIFFIL